MTTSFAPAPHSGGYIAKSRKRKRSAGSHNETDSGVQQEATSQQTGNDDFDDGYLYPHEASLPPLLHEAYKTAGQPFDEEPPEEPFPHRAISRHKPWKPFEMELELESLKPPIYRSAQLVDDYPQSSEKQKHVGHVNTLLHLCLLRGDYVRASRAFGMLLRTQVSARPLDIRSNGFWAIGIELLLRNSSSNNENQGVYSLPGFESARKYFERIFVHFPHKRSEAALLPIYLGYFKLWIATISHQHKKELTELEEVASDDESDEHTESDNAHGRQSNSEQDVYKDTYHRANEVLKRIDRAMTDVRAYSQDSTFVALRESVLIWAGDLQRWAKLDNEVEMGESSQHENSDSG